MADETREGDVYRQLLDKLEQARKALGVLGKLQFEGKPLRDLLLEAIRHGDSLEVQAWLTTAVEGALDRSVGAQTRAGVFPARAIHRLHGLFTGSAAASASARTESFDSSALCRSR